MPLPEDYVDGDVLTAADINAITTAVNDITPIFAKYSYTTGGTTTTTSTNYTNTGASLSYTPLNASNNLIVSATVGAGFFGDNINRSIKRVWLQIYNSTSATSITEQNLFYETEVASDDPKYLIIPGLTLTKVVAASTTSARTYVVRVKVDDANYTGVVGDITLSVTEVTP